MAGGKFCVKPGDAVVREGGVTADCLAVTGETLVGVRETRADSISEFLERTYRAELAIFALHCRFQMPCRHDAAVVEREQTRMECGIPNLSAFESAPFRYLVQQRGRDGVARRQMQLPQRPTFGNIRRTKFNHHVHPALKGAVYSFRRVRRHDDNALVGFETL